MSEITPFFVDRAKGGRASCKGCKGNCPSGELRLAKLVASPYGENQSMKSWYHVDCLMNALLKQRPATKRVDSVDDIGNWGNVSKEDQDFILKKLNETEKLYADKHSGKYSAKVLKNESAPNKITIPVINSPESKETVTEDNAFSTFFTLCKKIARVDAYTEKTAVVNNFFRNGTKDEFKGDLVLWCKLLLPQATKRVYNLKSKQLVKLFSKIFNTDHDDMLTHLEQGDIADTIQHFFTKSKNIVPAKVSTVTIQNIDQFLEELSKLTKEEEQIYHFKKIVKKCTLDDMKMLIRLIKGDLRINTGPKHILEGIHPDAYTAFQTSRDLNMVLDRIMSQSNGVQHKDAAQSSLHAKISIMTPVLPMLAEACKSVEMAMKKCPNGMFSEIKYDGERVQVHKKGNEFKYFSRALKPVMPHKVNHFKDYLPQAFPKGTDLILDAEVLMVDVNTGKPLPFGTLGIHKQSEFKDAQVCLFVFDCLYYNGQVLIDLPIRKRRQFLYDNMVEVTNHIMYSEQQLIKKPGDLAMMIAEVLQLGLEGLVLKDLESTYEPGKRHWLKVKKDYLFDGAMADTADLVVLGAWFGTGKKGGMMSVFLMGCLDTSRNKWVTVTKVHTGHDDSTLERLQKELKPLMNKISQDYHKLPSWMDCNKGMVPDFVPLDPKKQPVWEITGTELTKANLHTADGISVRFPRVTRIRTDKDWETATNLDELKHLFKTSKEKTDVSLLTKLSATASTSSDSYESPKKKMKEGASKVSKIDSFFVKTEKKSPEEAGSRNGLIKIEKKSPQEAGSRNDFIKKEKLSPKDDLDTSNLPSTSKKFNKNSDYSEVDEKLNMKNGRKRKRDKETFNGSNVSDNNGIEDNINTDKITPSISKSDEKNRRGQAVDSNSSSVTSNHETESEEIDAEMDQQVIVDTKNMEKGKKKSRKRKRVDESDSSQNESGINSHDDISLEEKGKHKKGRHNNGFDTKHLPEMIILTFTEKDDMEPENPLPDTFLNKRLAFYPDFISIPEEERIDYERHWIAYGGTVIKSIRSINVDYVVHNEEVISFKQMQKLLEKLEAPARHVNKNWLIECINDCTLYDTKSYAVIVEP